MIKIKKRFDETKINPAFWIHRGVIHNIGNLSHLEFVVKNPEKFGFTEIELKEIINLYGEEKVKEDIFENAYRLGRIKIRHYTKQNRWLVLCDNFYRRQNTIIDFFSRRDDLNIKEQINIQDFNNQFSISIKNLFEKKNGMM